MTILASLLIGAYLIAFALFEKGQEVSKPELAPTWGGLV
jgi:hypothetical protein